MLLRGMRTLLHHRCGFYRFARISALRGIQMPIRPEVVTLDAFEVVTLDAFEVVAFCTKRPEFGPLYLTTKEMPPCPPAEA